MCFFLWLLFIHIQFITFKRTVLATHPEIWIQCEHICIYLYAYMLTAHSEMQPHPELWVQLWFFFSSCNFRLGDSEQNNDLNLQVHECCMQHTLKHNVKIWFVMVLMLVHTEWLVSAFQDVWYLFFSVLEFQIWLTYTWFASLCCVFFVAVYFYWFYMCRHCSLSCEIHLVNNMTIFWNVNFICWLLILFGNIVQKCVCINAIHVEHQMLITRKRKYYFCFAGCCLMCYIVL